jgi:hypothetical protein
MAVVMKSPIFLDISSLSVMGFYRTFGAVCLGYSSTLMMEAVRAFVISIKFLPDYTT